MEPAVARTCPTCGHALARDAEVCPQCGRDDTNPFVSPTTVPSPAHRAPGRLLVGVSAIVGIGILTGLVAPGVAIVWTVIATPALVRAVAAIQRRREAGFAIRWEDRFHASMASTGVAVLAGIAATAAFVAVCFPTGLPFFTIHGPDGPPRGITIDKIGQACAFLLGFVAAGAAGFFIMKRFWPRKITEAKNA